MATNISFNFSGVSSAMRPQVQQALNTVFNDPSIRGQIGNQTNTLTIKFGTNLKDGARAIAINEGPNQSITFNLDKMGLVNGEVYFGVGSLLLKPFIDTAIHEAIHIIYPQINGNESFHGKEPSPNAVTRGQDAAGEFAFRSITTSEIQRLTGRAGLEEQDVLEAARTELNNNPTTRPDLSGVIWDSYTPDQIRAAITDKTSIYWGHLSPKAQAKNYDLEPQSTDPWLTQEDFEDGSSTIKEDDFYDTQPWDELDITKDATGEITNAEVTLDPAVAAFTGSVGQIFGSAIGRALAPNDPFARIAVTTVAGAIGTKFAQVLSASLTIDASQINISTILATGPVDLRAAGAGAVASFLVAELGEQLHLTGFTAQLFNAAVGGFAGSLANQVARDGIGVLAGAAWGNALSAAEINVGGTLGSILSNLIHPAETQTGAIGGQLLGAIGSLAAATAIGTAAGLFLNIIVPGIGSLIGTLLGTMIGDAFGSTPHPTSVDIIEPTSYLYSHHHWAGDDGGDPALSAQLSSAVTEIVNADLAALNGIGLAASRQPIMIGYHTGYPAEPYITGWFPNGGEAPRFASAADAVNSVAIEIMQNTQVIGGNLLLKRAHQYSNYQDTGTLAGDMQIAVDYETYLNNREVINALMAANPDTAFTAGWAATFARARELKLDQSTSIDVFGGLVGFLHSVGKAGLGAAANATVKYSGSNLAVDVKIANGADVPGSLSVFANGTSETSDASGTTVTFTFANSLTVGGYHGPQSATLVSGVWQVIGAAGNNLWFGSASAPNEYHDTQVTPSHDILIGGAQGDFIYAGGGFDFVDGGAGDDRLYGEEGNDILRGGKGYDGLQGGRGGDAYVFNRGDGKDMVIDHYSYMELDSAGSSGAPSSGGGSSHEVHDDGGADTLVFGPGIRVSDVSVRFGGDAGNDLIVGIKDPASPGAAPADEITLQNWADWKDRVETFVFADGTTLHMSAQFGAYQVPFGAALSGRTVAENSANGTKVGTVAGFDLKDSAALTYSLAGNAGGRFAIDATTGAITVAAPIDYEATTSHSYDITVRIADQGGYFVDKGFTIAVTNVSGLTLNGDSGNNALAGSPENDILHGGAGYDWLQGGGGDDTYLFNRGDSKDAVSDSGGADSLLFGAGIRGSDVSINFGATGGVDLMVEIRDPANPGAQPADVVTLLGWANAMERVETFRFADGTALNSAAIVNAGNGGNNLIAGLTDAVAIDGGIGDDTVSYAASAAAVNVNLALGTGLGGDAQWDTLVNVENLTGSAWNDALTGDAFANNLAGGAGNDLLMAGGGDDTLDGGDGNDQLLGEEGNDILRAGKGYDWLQGGGGDDRFIFAPGDGNDAIAGFAAGALTDDRIDLTAYPRFKMTGILNRTTQAGADTVIDFGGGDKITLQQVDRNNLNIDDFIGVRNVTVGDFSGDGKSDLLFLNNTSHGVAVWQMNGTQRTADGQAGIMNAAAGWRYENTGDFNGDGKADLLFQNGITHGVAVWQMNGTQRTADAQVGIFNADGGWRLADVADFNGDGKSDLLFLNDATHGVAVWQMDGLHVDHGAQAGIMSAGWSYADKGDFNGDGKTDLLFQNNITHGVAVWQMDGAQRTADAQVGIIDAAAGWRYDRTGDFNGDGKTDLLMLNDTTHGIAVWQMNGTQGAANAQAGTFSAAWRFVDAADFNGDGKSDLLFLNDTTHGVAVWQMDGAQVTAAAQVAIMNAAGGWRYENLGDFNGDGKADLLFQNGITHGIAVWQMNGTNVDAAAQAAIMNAAADWHLVA